MRWAGHVAGMGDMRNAYNIFVVKSERNTPFGRPRRRWDNNIKMDLREMEWEVVDWIHLPHDRDQQ
jgi:hypothetical protein